MKRFFVLLFMFAAVQGALIFNHELVSHFSASAEEISTGGNVKLDTSTKNDGYINVRITPSNPKKIVVMITKGTNSCNYTVDKNGRKDALPLQFGNGDYTVKVLENIQGTQYAVLYSIQLTVTYNKANAPFLVPTQFINYTSESEAVKKAAELCEGKTTDLEKLNAIYPYVVNNLKYDNEFAGKVTSGTVTAYIPAVDSVLASKKGICFDYSSLLGAMLRSQGIPTRLIMGYVAPNNIYHAWNEVYLTNIGWVKLKGDTYFDGVNWSRMDATFASTSNNQNISSFIGNGTNYKTTYYY